MLKKVTFLFLFVMPKLVWCFWHFELAFDPNLPLISRINLLTDRKILRVAFPDYSFEPIYDKSGILIQWGEYHLVYEQKPTRFHPNTLNEIYTKSIADAPWSRETLKYSSNRLIEVSSRTFAKGKDIHEFRYIYEFLNSKIIAQMLDNDMHLGTITTTYGKIKDIERPLLSVVSGKKVRQTRREFHYDDRGLLAMESLYDLEAGAKWYIFYDRSMPKQIRVFEYVVLGPNKFHSKPVIILELSD